MSIFREFLTRLSCRVVTVQKSLPDLTMKKDKKNKYRAENLFCSKSKNTAFSRLHHKTTRNLLRL